MEGLSFFQAIAALLILLQLTVCMNSCSAMSPIPEQTSTEYIKTSCNATLYPQLCYHSLSRYASKIQTSPKLLASMALSVTLAAANSTSFVIKNMSRSEDLRPREAGALQDCVELLGESVDELQESWREMGHLNDSNFELHMSNIQTWVSAALTDDDTCLDGFAGNSMNGNVKTAVRRCVVKVSRLTSVALALINKYASVHITSY